MEGVALGVQEERLSNVARVPTTLQEQSRIGEYGESSCWHIIAHNLNVYVYLRTFPVGSVHVHV